MIPASGAGLQPWMMQRRQGGRSFSRQDAETTVRQGRRGLVVTRELGRPVAGEGQQRPGCRVDGRTDAARRQPEGNPDPGRPLHGPRTHSELNNTT